MAGLAQELHKKGKRLVDPLQEQKINAAKKRVTFDDCEEDNCEEYKEEEEEYTEGYIVVEEDIDYKEKEESITMPTPAKK